MGLGKGTGKGGKRRGSGRHSGPDGRKVMIGAWVPRDIRSWLYSQARDADVSIGDVVTRLVRMAKDGSLRASEVDVEEPEAYRM